MTTLDDYDLSAMEAEELTIEINETFESRDQSADETERLDKVGWKLVEEAHRRKAWLTLEYGSWKEYVEQRLKISSTHSYELVTKGQVVNAFVEVIADACPAPDTLQVSGRQAQRIKPHLQEALQEVEEAVAQGEIPVEAVKKVVEKYGAPARPVVEEWRHEALSHAAFESFNDPLIGLTKIHEAVEAFHQKWELPAVVGVITKIHGWRDIELEVARLSQNIDALMEIREIMQGALARERI